jgi:uncharacterized protein YqjF (DUF2071 family)
MHALAKPLAICDTAASFHLHSTRSDCCVSNGDMSSTFLTAEWRKLIMAQYEVAPSLLASYVPRGVELDLHHGRCFVSLVGFLFDRVRVLRVPVPFHTRFEEVNLRLYVKRAMPDGTFRRGVVFISEIVPRAAITFTARALYGEAYRTAPMRHLWRQSERELDISYSWKTPGMQKRKWQHLAVQSSPQSQPIEQGSVDEFITEHYWGYTNGSGLLRGDNVTGEYGVAHPRWQQYPVHATQVAADFGALYGKAFAGLNEREPDHVLLAEGSAISIRQGSAIRTSDSGR